jgi:hypothetical protein
MLIFLLIDRQIGARLKSAVQDQETGDNGALGTATEEDTRENLHQSGEQGSMQ